LARAWPNLTLTVDPIAASLKADQQHAEAVGLAKPVELNGIYDLRILNGLLTASGQPPVTAGGLGQE
jgi:NitT/TauT family transport system substrate-binding protein